MLEKVKENVNGELGRMLEEARIVERLLGRKVGERRRNDKKKSERNIRKELG